MKFSLRWLSNYVDITLPVPQLLEKITLGGTEVESFSTTGVTDSHLVVGQIISSQPHPNADRLRVCRVADGNGERQVVCGAKNYKDGDKVPLALPGAKLPGGLVIKESKLRGELSQGMLCSAKELALAEDAEGLLILPPDAPVGKNFAEYHPGDTFFDVEVTSNRPDLLSYQGMARELVALGIATPKPSPLSLPHFPSSSPQTFTAQLSSPELGPFYTLVHLHKVKVAPSPQWLQDAIIATGHRPINNVVDITNFVLFETGQPLHAFDASTLSGKIIDIRLAQAEEKLLALDDQTYTLTPQDLVIADASGPIALAGVMGGKPTGVTATTTEVVLEAAWFLPATVRRTSRRLGLSSDSSYRFERRVNPGGLLAARDRALTLLQELTGAEIVAPPFLVGTMPPARPPISLRSERIPQILGVEIPATTIDRMLTALDCTKVSSTETVTVWQPPQARHDLEREIDLIEELARLYGLDAIPAELRTLSVQESDADKIYDRSLRLRRALASRGWDECITDALIQRDFAQKQPASVSLLNPLNELYTHLRPDLKTSLIQVASKNLARGVAQVQIFEIGRVYQKTETSTAEPLRLGLLVAGLGQTASWTQPERASDFYDLSGTLEFLRQHAGVEAKDLLLAEPVSKDELKDHGIKVPVFYAEISLDSWPQRIPQPERYQPVPAFPPVRRDLAIVVSQTLPQEKVAQTIRAAQPPHLAQVTLFDLFRDAKGEKIAADKKSLAYAFTFRAPDRTLTEKEVNESYELIRKKLVDELACSFRE